MHKPGQLPAVVLAEIVKRDADGELIAQPVEWDSAQMGQSRKFLNSPRPPPSWHRSFQALAIAALVRTELAREAEPNAPAYTGRVIKIIDHPKHRVLGIFRKAPHGGGRLEPVDKKMLGKELNIPASATADAQDGDLVAVETSRAPRLGLPTGRVIERLGSLASERAVSLIAIHAHSIPHVFRHDTSAEAEAARPASLAHREDWRRVPLITIDPPDAKDHDDAVHAEQDTAADNHGGFIVSVAIADVAHYVTPGSALDREALVRGNSVYFPDRVVPMLPERISNDLCSLRPREDRAALAVRMVIGADGRKRSHNFHRIMMRSAAKLINAQFRHGGCPTRRPKHW